MKLVVQIPCLNEEDTLPQVLGELPRRLQGFDEVEWLVIDDGSTDRTIDVARAAGADHIVRLTRNQGLATAFQVGMDAALKLGADVIVNTDGDNQYRAADIPRLVEPILEKRADIVVGDRQVRTVQHFPPFKRFLQRLGSWVVRQASGVQTPDATSGFRAYSREAALKLQVVSRFTYTLESLIQAGKMGVAVEHVPISVNPSLRASRLFDSTSSYVLRNALALFRAYALYEPLRVFTAAAAILALGALGAWMPFLLDWILNGDTSGHLQSLILGAVLAVVAVQMFALGVLGDTLGGQRVITQRAVERIRRLELATGVEPVLAEDREPTNSEPPKAREGRDSVTGVHDR
jgi:glycosyltransferase involved in cell wall biosynthesis